MSAREQGMILPAAQADHVLNPSHRADRKRSVPVPHCRGAEYLIGAERQPLPGQARVRAGYPATIPASRARSAAALRVRTPSLPKMRETWCSTVRTLMKS